MKRPTEAVLTTTHMVFILNTLCLLLVVPEVLFAQAKRRVFVFTDINIDAGDPDDRQSLVHLLWYANELDIEGIVPERWDARSIEACDLALDAYQRDYEEYKFRKKGYPEARELRNVVANDTAHVLDLFKQAASDRTSPLYVLVWGNLLTFNRALYQFPELSDNIRLLTIGTGLMMERDIPYLPDSWPKMNQPCEQYNWNGFGRNRLYDDPRFRQLWWIEMNWTYAGMFSGEDPAEMFDSLSEFGSLGRHIKEVVKNEPWAQYFRVGDTPSVLYIVDASHDVDKPTESSWAGKFAQPFPSLRPSYYTDFSDTLAWNYADPCLSWGLHEEVSQVAKSTLESRRGEMYEALIRKLDQAYR